MYQFPMLVHLLLLLNLDDIDNDSFTIKFSISKVIKNKNIIDIIYKILIFIITVYFFIIYLLKFILYFYLSLFIL